MAWPLRRRRRGRHAGQDVAHRPLHLAELGGEAPGPRLLFGELGRAQQHLRVAGLGLRNLHEQLLLPPRPLTELGFELAPLLLGPGEPAFRLPPLAAHGGHPARQMVPLAFQGLSAHHQSGVLAFRHRRPACQARALGLGLGDVLQRAGVLRLRHHHPVREPRHLSGYQVAQLQSPRLFALRLDDARLQRDLAVPCFAKAILDSGALKTRLFSLGFHLTHKLLCCQDLRLQLSLASLHLDDLARKLADLADDDGTLLEKPGHALFRRGNFLLELAYPVL
mmetsp:Transcript_112162/g.362151  ORF Transcript_112162/g.362151 Transcript_112162/m.362151 type:complete len:279 (-) Transcript_112162:664-1500(-)